MQTDIVDNLNVSPKHTLPAVDSFAIPGVDGVESWLRAEVTWPEGVSMRGLRLKRLWPSKHGAVTFELAVDVQVFGENTTCVIQAGPLERIKPAPPCREAVLDAGWIMNLSLSNTELGISLLSPDRDPRLSVTQDGQHNCALPKLLCGTQAANFLGLKDDGSDLHQQVVAYRIGKRCVLRLNNRELSGRPSAFLKSFRRMPTEELLHTYRCLGSCLQQRSDGRIRAPAILDHLPDARVLLFEGAESSAGHLTSNADDLCLAANVLALLHAAPMTCSRSHRPKDEVDIAHRWLPILKSSDRQHHKRLLALVERLTKLSERLPSGVCCLVHRDFYAAQVLRKDEKTWIVDLDTMSMGHPEVDIATFSAHLLLDEIVKGSTDEEAASLVRFFVGAYRNYGRQLCPEHLRFYIMSATARLAAIHATRGLDRQIVARLWRMAEQTPS